MNTQQIRRCVLYARLSVTKEESVSIVRQLQSCRQYAEARHWEVVGEFIDDGVSATANRPEVRKGWSALLQADGFDAVVIWKVDRLARRVLDFLHADETLQARGAGLVAVDDPIDMTSPQGRAFAVMLAVFGEMEAEATRARVRAARAQLIANGRFPGGGIPYGFTSCPNEYGPGKVLTIDPERHEWLLEIASLGLEGAGASEIAHWLTDVGAPLPRGHQTMREGRASGNQPRGKWNRQTIAQLLRNPMLAGMIPRNPGRSRSTKQVDPFAVVRDENNAPIIDESLAVISFEQFAELQQLLNGRSSADYRNVTGICDDGFETKGEPS